MAGPTFSLIGVGKVTTLRRFVKSYLKDPDPTHKSKVGWGFSQSYGTPSLISRRSRISLNRIRKDYRVGEGL